MINWRYIWRMYVLMLTTFSIFRLILLFMHADLIGDASLSTVIQALLMGLRFDLVISSYILLIPFLILSVQLLYPVFPLWFLRMMHVMVNVICILTFIVCAADIPWFNQFFSRMNISAFQWMDHPEFVFNMIAAEPRYFLALTPVLFFTVTHLTISRIWISPLLRHASKGPGWKTVSTTLLGILIVFIGIRGRLEPKSPIRIGTAYFSNNAFLNQLGLNPNFTLLRSYLDSRDPRNKKVYFIHGEDVLPEVASNLGITTFDPVRPVYREIQIDPDSVRPNVIVVLMESMNSKKLSHFGNPDSLTPFLDSIMDMGLSFTNCYTAGTHTYHGIFSTLFSYPALFMQHPMKTGAELRYNGLPSELKKNGYETIYFTTHDGQFDNAEGFLLANGMDRVISKDHYPSENVKSALGVPDDFMFNFSLPILNKMAQSGHPFLSVYLTASDHGPFIVPPYFKPRSNELRKQIVEYADWSIKRFIEQCSEQPWFSNTVFVFIADHGSWFGSMYDMPLSFHHSPLLYYQPGRIAPAVVEKLGGQIDVFPTLMGLLKLPYTNNTFGIDLNKQERPYMYFSSDFQYGVISDSLYLILNRKGDMSLHRYRHLQTDNIASHYPNEVSRMKRYAQTHMQASQILKDKKMTFISGE